MNAILPCGKVSWVDDIRVCIDVDRFLEFGRSTCQKIFEIECDLREFDVQVSFL